MEMTKRIVLGIAILLCTQIGTSQGFEREKLDAYFDTLQKHNKFMGSVAISKNNQIIYTKTVGYADEENKIPANKNSKYRIGSISKTFTAVLVFQAVENGLLNLDEKLDQYYPAIQNSEKITLANLLNHQSGIHNFTDYDEYFSYNTEPKSEDEMVEIIKNGGSDFEPGSQSEYSNSNYVLLSLILEDIYKMPYPELLDKKILQPLGLRNTYFGRKINVKDNECKSYRWVGHWEKETETDLSIPLGAGGIVSTPSDLVMFSNALFGNKLLQKQSLMQMETIKDGYGMGLFQFPFGDKKGFGHTGGIDGFTSVFTHFEAEDISYALTCNGANMNTNDISIAVLSAAYNRSFNIPEFTDYKASAEDLENFSGVYSSSQLPLKITLSAKNGTLIAQATGQPEFALEAVQKNKFKYDPAGVVMEFDPTNNIFVLQQGGGSFTFKKE